MDVNGGANRLHLGRSLSVDETRQNLRCDSSLWESNSMCIKNASFEDRIDPNFKIPVVVAMNKSCQPDEVSD